MLVVQRIWVGCWFVAPPRGWIGFALQASCPSKLKSVGKISFIVKQRKRTAYSNVKCLVFSRNRHHCVQSLNQPMQARVRLFIVIWLAKQYDPVRLFFWDPLSLRSLFIAGLSNAMIENKCFHVATRFNSGSVTHFDL